MRYLLFLCLFLVGCGSSILTESAYSNLEEGMTLEEVDEQLKGAKRSHMLDIMGETMYQWTDSDAVIVVNFKGGKLIEKHATRLGN